MVSVSPFLLLFAVLFNHVQTAHHCRQHSDPPDPNRALCCAAHVQDRPDECLFRLPSIKAGNCSCVTHFGGTVTDVCKWNTKVFAVAGRITCEPFIANCVKTSDIAGDRKTMTCIPKAPEYAHAYPPRFLAFKNVPDKEHYYCKAKSLGLATYEDFYSSVLTCVLPDCESRNYIPDAANAMGHHIIMKGTPASLCLPPVMRDRIPIPYCKLYADHQNTKFFEPVVEGTSFDPAQFEGACALPPICNPDGRVDPVKYVIPFVDGKADDTYCEKMCVGSQLPGKDANGRDTCRARPNLEGTYNPYKIPVEEMLPMCADPAHSYLHEPPISCSPIPICDSVGFMAQLGHLNPWRVQDLFGVWLLGRVTCAPEVFCDEKITADKYDCTEVEDKRTVVERYAHRAFPYRPDADRFMKLYLEIWPYENGKTVAVFVGCVLTLFLVFRHGVAVCDLLGFNREEARRRIRRIRTYKWRAFQYPRRRLHPRRCPKKPAHGPLKEKKYRRPPIYAKRTARPTA